MDSKNQFIIAFFALHLNGLYAEAININDDYISSLATNQSIQFYNNNHIILTNTNAIPVKFYNGLYGIRLQTKQDSDFQISGSNFSVQNSDIEIKTIYNDLDLTANDSILRVPIKLTTDTITLNNSTLSIKIQDTSNYGTIKTNSLTLNNSEIELYFADNFTISEETTFNFGDFNDSIALLNTSININNLSSFYKTEIVTQFDKLIVKINRENKYENIYKNNKQLFSVARSLDSISNRYSTNETIQQINRISNLTLLTNVISKFIPENNKRLSNQVFRWTRMIELQTLNGNDTEKITKNRNDYFYKENYFGLSFKPLYITSDKSKTFGFSTGLNYFNRDINYGIIGTFGTGDFKGNSYSGKNQSYNTQIYLNKKIDTFRFSGLLGYDITNFNKTRYIPNQEIESEPKSQSIYTTGQISYELKSEENISLFPTMEIGYQKISFSKLSEKDNPFAITENDFSDDMIFFGLGLKISSEKFMNPTYVKYNAFINTKIPVIKNESDLTTKMGGVIIETENQNTFNNSINAGFSANITSYFHNISIEPAYILSISDNKAYHSFSISLKQLF